jgi:hypothetical protein
MQPDHLEHRSGKGLVIVHRCLRCGARQPNRVADEAAHPDDIGAIASLGAAGAYSRPAARKRRS